VGKHYPNVWLNACWIYLITMAGSRQILSEWIDLVPADRLLGFGPDVARLMVLMVRDAPVALCGLEQETTQGRERP